MPNLLFVFSNKTFPNFYSYLVQFVQIFKVTHLKLKSVTCVQSTGYMKSVSQIIKNAQKLMFKGKE
jgi:hypothetical protein